MSHVPTVDAEHRPDSAHLVEAVNVIKHFGSNEVLKGVDLTVDKGEVVCLLGPSCSGKTTFLRLINQMESLTGGRIWVGGELIGIEELTPAHLAPLRFMREDSAKTGVTPTLRRLQRVGGFDVKELFALFPGKPMKKMAWLAGLPKPVGCV